MDVKSIYDIYLDYPEICTDSRYISMGCLFVALRGNQFDGNSFAPEALEKGAAFALVSDPSLKGQRYIYVEDTLTILQSLAHYHRRQFSIPFVAITGSNGKTTTKELIASVLSKKFTTRATKGNLNNHIGVPLTLLSLSKDVEIAVIEMGANHMGEIMRLCEMAMPTHGLITNIGLAHLEGFGSPDGVKKAKGELFEYLKKNNGFAFVNSDDPNVWDLGKDIIQKTTYGFKESNAPEVLFRYSISVTDCGFCIEDARNGAVIHSSMFGHYNASNMLAAYTVGRHFGIEVKSLEKSLEDYIPGANRSEVILHLGCIIVKDAYNANPSSMELALKAFAEKYPDGWVVLGSMKELGSETDQAHRQIVELALALDIKNIFLVGEEFKRVAGEKNIKSLVNLTVVGSIDELKLAWNWSLCENKALLLKGSRSMALEKLLA